VPERICIAAARNVLIGFSYNLSSVDQS